MAYVTFDNILTNFPLFIQKQLTEIYTNTNFGLTAIGVNDIVPIFPQEPDEPFSYHFTLKIPYAGKRLCWEIMFCPEDPNFAPDFDFNDDSFLMNADVELISNNIPSLCNWDVENPENLLLVLKEFMILYDRAQLDKLQNENIYSRIFTEYTLLTSEETGVSPKDVEIIVDTASVYFLIALKVNYSELPEFRQPSKKSSVKLNPGKDVTNLKVSFLKLDGSKVNTSLLLSPRLEQSLGNATTLHIPSYSKETSLVEYVPLITKLLQTHITDIEIHHKLKKEYINYLATMCNYNIIELDTETYNKGVILCEVNDFYCLVHIDIGKKFPNEKPKVTLYSVYCSNQKKQCCQVVENYPYSPRWNPEMMLTKLLEFLSACILEFEQHKH